MSRPPSYRMSVHPDVQKRRAYVEEDDDHLVLEPIRLTEEILLARERAKKLRERASSLMTERDRVKQEILIRKFSAFMEAFLKAFLESDPALGREVVCTLDSAIDGRVSASFEGVPMRLHGLLLPNGLKVYANHMSETEESKRFIEGSHAAVKAALARCLSESLTQPESE